jgi:serine/threonine protein kinase
LNEIKTTSAVKHQHVIRVFLTYEVRTKPGQPKQELGLLMIPVAQENLQEFLARHDDPRIVLSGYSKELIQQWFDCFLNGLAFIHSKRVRHGDVKPSNILIKDGSVLYADFGISRIFQNDERTTTDNTSGPHSPMYCAPEVTGNLPKNSKSDVFSLGCVFMEMITVLCRRSLQDFAEYRGKEGNQAYHRHPNECRTWMRELRIAVENDSSKRAQMAAWRRGFDLCRMMTIPNMLDRCTSADGLVFLESPEIAKSGDPASKRVRNDATETIDPTCSCQNIWRVLIGS